jgi:hypothetical protein
MEVIGREDGKIVGDDERRDGKRVRDGKKGKRGCEGSGE